MLMAAGPSSRRLDGRPVFHDHELGRVVIGCPACIAETRAAEETARWAEAPIRKVTWTCTYHRPQPGDHRLYRLSFTLEVRVPPDATDLELDGFYADLTWEAFVMALPADVPMNDTEFCRATMDVVDVRVGPLVDPPTPAGVPQPALFDVDGGG